MPRPKNPRRAPPPIQEVLPFDQTARIASSDPRDLLPTPKPKTHEGNNPGGDDRRPSIADARLPEPKTDLPSSPAPPDVQILPSAAPRQGQNAAGPAPHPSPLPDEIGRAHV